MLDLREFETILAEVEDGILTIYLNQPKKRNALSQTMIAEITSVLDEVSDNNRIRAIVFKGKGGVFSAGADLASFQKILSAKEGQKPAAFEANKEGGQFFLKVHSMPQLTIAHVEGAAMAGGLGLACACDYILAEETAKFAFTETRIGLPPAQIAPYVLKRLGYQAAKKMLLMGASIRANEAQKTGLVDDVYDSEASAGEKLEVLKGQIIACAPNAFAATKALIDKAESHRASAFIDVAAECFASAFAGDEAGEGIRSFFEKRKPVWS
ncbi:enoyl-CoA hydratase/isomerase family protein [Flexibacterium corallicola]|uniref:enoyl-CoA hydratase/isomerase family protein n=1 Tax=Flexibacterium corallicola TaxID=3037259 RepID=UPI00286F88BE|nr:enoyl-CoA hydratase/isomerase family protein [Pseudovibrio sp. M1P-2-3]